VAVVGIAGTTDGGTIDPLVDMASLCERYGVHFHVDAAWGAPLLFSERYRGRIAGIERADTVTIDGHKQLFLPIGIGMTMSKNPDLVAGIEKTADYTIRSGSSDLGRRALEGSRPGMALFLHAALNIIGSRGYSILVGACVERGEYFAKRVRGSKHFELLLEPDLGIVLYRYLPRRLRGGAGDASARDHANQINARIHTVQRELGCAFVGKTIVGDGIVALRAVLSNPRIANADIDAVLGQQQVLGDSFDS
jgi:glutamate decarboxylase